jgi:Fic family protein
MDEVTDWLSGDDQIHPIVCGAMAPFHIAAVHPFCDGNGRTARVVQSLVLAKAGRMAPAFASIERYLGDHTNDYYRALGASQGGHYDPTSDVTPWLRFAIAAHRHEALALRERLETASKRREFVEQLLRSRSLPVRMATVLDACLLGSPIRRDEYMREEEVARATAIQDLRVLVGAGLISREGGSRNTRYRASPELARLYESASD